MHQRLTDKGFGGYHVEVLSDPFTCFDANNYGALLLVDPEDYFGQEEVVKLRDDIESNGLSIIVLADWYNQGIIDEVERG